MKFLSAALMCLGVLAHAAPPPPPAPPAPLKLSWGFPTNKMKGVVFSVLKAPRMDTPPSNWTTVTTTTNLETAIVLNPATHFLKVTTQQPPPKPFKLDWDFPAVLLPGVTFRIYESKIDTTPSTNTWSVVAWTTNKTVSFELTPGRHFLAATAANTWGESDFSNVVCTPPLIEPGDLTNLRIVP